MIKDRRIGPFDMIIKLMKPLVERFPEMARFYRLGRETLDRNQPSVATPWGFTIAGGHPDMGAGKYEPEETLVIRELIQQTDYLVNVGANVGYYCLHALSLGKPVIAIEPMARNVHYLMRNVCENAWSRNIEIYQLAAGESTDVLRIWGGGGDTGSGASLIPGFSGNPESYFRSVPVVNLDRIMSGLPKGRRPLVIVDIDGAELSLLKGASTTLRSEPSPIWFVEITSVAHQPRGVNVNPDLIATFDTFLSHGYEATAINQGAIPISMKDVRSAYDLKTSLPTQNFLFRKPNVATLTCEQLPEAGRQLG